MKYVVILLCAALFLTACLWGYARQGFGFGGQFGQNIIPKTCEGVVSSGSYILAIHTGGGGFGTPFASAKLVALANRTNPGENFVGVPESILVDTEKGIPHALLEGDGSFQGRAVRFRLEVFGAMPPQNQTIKLILSGGGKTVKTWSALHPDANGMPIMVMPEVTLPPFPTAPAVPTPPK